MFQQQDKVLLSLIVPLIAPTSFLRRLLLSMISLQGEYYELILVNQSGKSVPADFFRELNLKVIDKVLPSPIPASEARNLGASLASGQYIFFLDDDAFIFSGSEYIRQLFNGSNLDLKMFDVYVMQRGEISSSSSSSSYLSHWPQNTRELNIQNFPRTLIEWNFIIKKDVFLKIGNFYLVGPGSNHAALCGEAYILAAYILSGGYSVKLLSEVKVAHPSLVNSPKNVRTLLGYSYGMGYAVGYSMQLFNLKGRLYWLIRFGASLPVKLLLEGRLKSLALEQNVSSCSLRFMLLMNKALGFYDAITIATPRSSSWLDLCSSRILEE